MDLSKEALGLRYLIEGRDVSDVDLDAVLANAQRARALVVELGLENLLRSLDIRGNAQWAPDLQSIVIGVLEHFSSEASVRGDVGAWRACLEGMLLIQPGNAGIIFQLLKPLNEDGDHKRILELMEPLLFILIEPEHAEALAQFTPFVVTAAYQTGRLDLIAYLRDGRAAVGMPAPEAEAALLRMEALAKAGFSSLPVADGLSPLAAALRKAALGLDEFAVISALEQASATDSNGADVFTLRLALVVAGLTLAQSWARPYRSALGLAAECLARTLALSEARQQWLASDLPAEGLEAFFVMAVRQARASGLSNILALQAQPEWKQACCEAGVATDTDGAAAFHDALADFHACPSVDTAAVVWSRAYLSGQFADLVRAAPIGVGAGSTVERARSLQIAPLRHEARTPLWLLLTWHVEPDHLLRKLAAYAGDATLVVSIGSDAHPSGLARATAALFCDRVQFLVRPVVTWGGQRGWHHNMLEVMELFRANSDPSAWLQVVCDRTYPLKSMQRLGQLTAQGRVYRPNTSTTAWRKEWDDETVEHLPSIYNDAINEVFSKGSPEKFLELSTRSPIHGTSEYRLNASTFNYSSNALPVDVGGRSSVHQYMISPFEADVKWLSFARLQEFVDVATESRSTYVRRLHPVTMRWAHSVLMKYDLRIGDPWVYVSRKFVERVLDDPGFDELFTVMNLGFAPEMNYMDTCAASFHLYDEISHHFHITPGEVVSDKMLPQVSVGADQHDKSFIRKTDPTESGELMQFFAERILEEHLHEGLHWMVAAGAFADDEDEPRPKIDHELLDRFVGGRVDVRDLIGSRVVPGRFEQDRITADDDGRLLATWSLCEGVLTVDHLDPPLGIKQYERAGGDGRVLTLAPSELVSPRNAWSAFLDFHLDSCNIEMDVSIFGADNAMAVLTLPSTWTGAATADAAILSVFADPTHSDIPTPTVKADAGVYEIREVDGVILALCSLDGFPALLQIAGFAQTRQRTAVHLKPVPADLGERWNEAMPSTVRAGLSRSDIPGAWTLGRLEGDVEIILDDGGWILGSRGQRLGRWLLRAQGLQILGLEGVLLGLAGHLRVEDGNVRLGGWGWRTMKDAVTFTLQRHPPGGAA